MLCNLKFSLILTHISYIPVLDQCLQETLMFYSADPFGKKFNEIHLTLISECSSIVIVDKSFKSFIFDSK